MKKIFVLILLSIGLYSSTAVDRYRDGGMGAVEKYINEQLQSKNYWYEKLSNFDVRFGYYENLDLLIIANKQAKTLAVYENSVGIFKLLAQYDDVIVGADGDKFIEGDLKTPIGVYILRKRFIPKDKFYGHVAFAISYPNRFDRAKGKNGHSIWIHGSPVDGSPRDPMSRGCIVFDNIVLGKLDNTIRDRYKNSIIIINEEGMDFVNKARISIILSELFRWKSSWKHNDIDDYMKFYDKNFIRHDGTSRADFYERKKSLFSRGQKKEIVFSGINISPYPDESKRELFRVVFHQIFNTKTYRFKGDKELLIELKGDTFSILIER
jgi:murein L,D-transpeptidase YafK